MSRIVPSQLVAAIENTYPWAKKAADGTETFGGSLGPDQATKVGMILGLLRNLPDELFPTSPDSALMIEAAKAAMEGALTGWSGGPHPGLAPQLGPSRFFGDKHPIVAALIALRECKDEAASLEAPSLLFIANEDARNSLRIDVGTAFRAYGNGEFKAATVLAGAVVEALLLWRIKETPTSVLGPAISAHEATMPTRKVAGKDPERWDLIDLISVASHVPIIDEQTEKVCGLCREFRNLIHPGRVLKTGADASKATALAALAAMQKLLELH